MEKVRGQNHQVQATFTRPNDAAPYTAGDVVADSTSAPTVITFNAASLSDSNAGGMQNGGIIQHAMLTSSANGATKLDAELWLFDTAPTLSNDNAVIAFLDADLNNLVGVIPFAAANWRAGIATAGAAGNAVCEATNLGIPFSPKGTNNNALFGVLVARNGYTPVAQEIFQFRIKILD